MNGGPCVLDVALDQLHSMDAPTAIVPVVCDGQAGVFYASYVGDEEWMVLAREEANPVDLAIACCKRAYHDALAQGGRMRATGGTR